MINQILFFLPSVAPSKPECKIVGTAEYGQTINLTCFSHEGSPKPTYTWQSFSVQNEPRVLETTNGMGISKTRGFELSLVPGYKDFEMQIKNKHSRTLFLGNPLTRILRNCPFHKIYS